MGSNASCSLVLSPTGKPFFWMGETIKGYANLTVHNSITVKYIDINIIGELLYEQTTSTPNGGTTTRTVRDVFFSENQPQSMPATNGIFYNEDGYHIEPNTYRLPFSMQLPTNLPPTLVGIRIPRIQYSLGINLARSWFHRNIRSKLYINMYPRTSPPRNVFSIEREESNFRDLHIYGKLLRNYLVVGEPFMALELSIQNPSHTTITQIVVTLYQHRHLGGKKAKITIFEYSLPGMIDFQNEHLHRTFQVPVSHQYDLLPPTLYWENTKRLFHKTWTVEYVLEVKFKTRLLFTNVTLEFPITVVTDKR